MNLRIFIYITGLVFLLFEAGCEDALKALSQGNAVESNEITVSPGESRTTIFNLGDPTKGFWELVVEGQGNSIVSLQVKNMTSSEMRFIYFGGNQFIIRPMASEEIFNGSLTELKNKRILPCGPFHFEITVKVQSAEPNSKGSVRLFFAQKYGNF